MAPMEVNMPAPSAGGGYTDAFRVTKAKHTIRVFPFDHEGQLELATLNIIHFVGGAPQACSGAGCPHCAEAVKQDDRRLRPVKRYVMAVVDINGDTDVILRYDAPASVYKGVYGLCQENGADAILGNEGTDVIIKYDKNGQPSDMYEIQARLKGSEVLDIDTDESVPDLIVEVANDRASMGTVTPDKTEIPDDAETTEDGEGEGPAESEPGTIKFKDSKGKVHEGVDTGKTRGEKRLIEADGRLWPVPEDQILGDDTEPEEKVTPFKKGDPVVFTDDEGNAITATVKKFIKKDKQYDVVDADGEDWTVNHDELSAAEVDTPEPDGPKGSKTPVDGATVEYEEADGSTSTGTVVSVDGEVALVDFDGEEYEIEIEDLTVV